MEVVVVAIAYHHREVWEALATPYHGGGRRSWVEEDLAGVGRRASSPVVEEDDVEEGRRWRRRWWWRRRSPELVEGGSR